MGAAVQVTQTGKICSLQHWVGHKSMVALNEIQNVLFLLSCSNNWEKAEAEWECYSEENVIKLSKPKPLEWRKTVCNKTHSWSSLVKGMLAVVPLSAPWWLPRIACERQDKLAAVSHCSLKNNTAGNIQALSWLGLHSLQSKKPIKELQNLVFDYSVLDLRW